MQGQYSRAGYDGTRTVYIFFYLSLGDDINISGLTDDWDGVTDENIVDNQVEKSVSDLSDNLNDFKNTNTENNEETPSQAKRRKTFLPPFRKQKICDVL